MNYKALATIFLLVLPMLAVPMAFANQPNWNVEFRIRPGDTKVYGPCKVSTFFPVDVYLWNDKSVSGVGVYAYDFYVYWQDNPYISLDNFVNHIPWPSGKYYLVINETGPSAFPGWDMYHLAVTAIGNSTLDPSLELGATGVFNASLVTLTFHVDSEPFYPAAAHVDFLIGNELGAAMNPVPNPDPTDPHVSTGCTVTITNIEIDQGAYDETVGQPEIDVEASLAAPFPDNFTFSAKGVTEKVYVHLFNITGAYGFAFDLTFDSTWKQTDIQHVTILGAFSTPYALLQMSVDNNSNPGDIFVQLIKPSEKSTLCTQDAAVIEIDFVTTPQVAEAGQIPTTHTSFFTITDAIVYCKDAQGHENDFLSSGLLLISPPLANIYVPKSDADINFDGIVDIKDLAKVAMAYGTNSVYSNFVLPHQPTPVDIYDVVYVAKRYLDP